MNWLSFNPYCEGSAVIVGFGLGLALSMACGSLALGLGLGVGLGAVMDGWQRIQTAQRTRRLIWR
jgi:hypothetical protein